MLCQAAGQRNHRPACETQLDPSVIPGAGWEQRGEQQSEVWPEGVVRSIQPGGELEEEKGQDEDGAAGPSARCGEQRGPGWVFGLCLGARMCQGGEQAG